ncbi:MAG TPA: glycosyl hydrolase 115 family protein [Mucilaginibacter sp.]
MKKRLFIIFAICFFSQLALAQTITIHGKIPVYIEPNETAPVRRAVTDLLRDLNTVFGQPSTLVNELPKKGPVIVIATGDSYKGHLPAAKGWEAHQLYADKGRIVLNGADMRGTIYAVYSFSELMLGVKPLWFWASEKPNHKEHVVLAANYKKVFKSPDIKYRAWLPNDTDLLSPWQKLSDDNYQALFEAMLRLKLNTLEGVIAGKESFVPPFKPGKDAATGQERGLVTTGHHLNIFGSTYGYWADYWQKVRNLPVPELTIANKQALKEFWGYHIDLARRNNLEVVWTVGFRGNRDIPFWEFFPEAPKDDKSRAKVIEDMVAMQISLLKEKTGNPHPTMRLTLYNEMSNFVAAGLFHIPNEPSLIRNFVAARRDHFPAQDIRTYSFSGQPVGYYLNFQFTSTGSHLAQAEGPRKMEQNYRIVDSLSGHHLVFSVVNAGNIREHVLELSANADMMWNFKPFNAFSFLKKFSTTYYGTQYSKEIALLYKDFFNSYWQQRKGDLPGFERQYLFQDMRYARAMEMLLSDLEKGKYTTSPLENNPLDDPSKGSVGYFRVVPADNGTPNQLEAMAKGTAASIAKLETITAKANLLYAKLQTGKVFFDDNLRGQAYLMLHLNRALNYLVKAYQSKDGQQARRQFLGQSLDEIHLAEQRLTKSHHVPFVDWYANDNKFGIKAIEKRLYELQ